MMAAERRATGMLVLGTVGGSLAGAAIRWAIVQILPPSTGFVMVQALVVSALGGAVLGALLGATLARRASPQPQSPLAAALAGAIGTFGAAVLLAASPTVGSSGVVWRDALLNIGVTIVTAGAVAILMSRRARARTVGR